MILLDTNVLIDAADDRSTHHRWARRAIADGVTGEGAAANAVTVAELCVGDAEPHTVADRIRGFGVTILDLPAAASEPCARAYRAYRVRRKAEGGGDAAAVPLPDFFIGAHALVMGFTLATADVKRFRAYFPKVRLKTP